MEGQIIHLFYCEEKYQWYLEYGVADEKRFYYDDFSDALVALGILAKELVYIMKTSVELRIHNKYGDLIKETYIAQPPLMENQPYVFRKKWFKV